MTVFQIDFIYGKGAIGRNVIVVRKGMCTIRDLSVDVEIGEFLGCIEDIESKESS
jgi:hypothetical protein